MKENGDEANDDAFDAFLRWCRANAIEVREDDVEFTFAVQKANKDRGVTAKRALERGAILAVIPFEACLTLKTCSRADVAASVEEALVKTKTEASWLCGLTAALCVERSLGLKSRYFAYDRVLPRCEANVVCAWNDGERSYLAGTEVETSLRDEAAAAKNEWERVVAPVFKEHGVECSFEQFIEARTVVSSRAFTLSPNAGVGLVPIADAFNHLTGNHHVNVGDGDAVVRSETGGEALCVKVTNEQGVRRGDEIFNTYGFHGNAKLLNSYGFTQNDNPADEVRLTTTNIRTEAALAGVCSGTQLTKRFKWLERTQVCAPDASFSISKSQAISEELCAVVWTLVASEDAFQKIRHTNRHADALHAIETVSTAINTMKIRGNNPSTLTPEVADVISLAIERRLSLYRSQTNIDGGVSPPRVELAIQLINSERAILNSALLTLTEFVNKHSHNRAKGSKDDSDAFALFD